MFILRWKHTRTKKDMLLKYKTYAQAMLRVFWVREIFPDHPFTLNGKPI